MKVRTRSLGTSGLRERKAARTRLALLDALVQRLGTREFVDVSVKELCDEVGVSEPTFFNYFGSKHELLVFYVRLWSVEMQSRMRINATSAFQGLARLFSFTAEAVVRTPRLMYEIISYQIRRGPAGSTGAPTPAELALRFADLPGAARYAPASIGAIVRKALAHARRVGEIPRSTDLAAAQSLIVSLFFGAPASHPDARDIPRAYTYGLRMIWRGLGGKIPQEEARS